VNARAAAWVAIVSAAAVSTALVVLLYGDLLAVGLALALLAIAGAAAWIGLTRRGPARFLGLATAAVALLADAIALIALGFVDDVLVVAAAAALFTVAGRKALRASPQRRPATAHGTPRTAQRGGRSVLIMNPKSGGGKVEKFDLVAESRLRGIEPILLERGDDLRVVAREAAKTADVIGMAGGDGSQALVAQVAMEQGVPFVCVPAGTRNHLALDLGVDRDDLVGALDAFGSSDERLIDLALANDQVFVNNVSLGVYAQIVQSREYRDAKLETMQTMLPELLGPDATPFDLRYRDPEGRMRSSAQLILVSNNPYVLDRVAGMGSRPRLDTGLLGIIAVEISGTAAAGTFISLEAIGQARRFDGWIEWSAEQFEVTSGGPIAAGVDGEATAFDPPLRFGIRSGALRVRLAPGAAGLSPSAAAPSLRRDSIRDLWRVGTGR
jgi:diacylglycerol kinase family enzyme